MSETRLYAIPLDPFFVPGVDLQDDAREVFARGMQVEQVEVVVSDPLDFVHGVQNQGSFTCPRCGETIPWSWIYGFAALTDVPHVTTPPCCRAEVPLGQLRSSTGEAFARFQLIADNPPMWEVPPEVLSELATVLGTEMASVQQRI
jgi:hypothetical protein